MISPDPLADIRPGRSSMLVPEAVAVDHRFDAEGLFGLRASVAAHADDLGTPRTQRENMVIVAGELATNAVRHGGGSGRLRLWREGHRLYCQVDDGGPGLPDPGAGSVPPAQTAVSGRGLWICRQLCDLFDIAVGSHGTTIRAAILLDDSPARATIT